MARQMYPKMKKGENCSLDYDPHPAQNVASLGTMNLSDTSMKNTASKSAQSVTDCTTLQEIAKRAGKVPYQFFVKQRSGTDLNSPLSVKC
jgi:hypothetical protein